METSDGIKEVYETNYKDAKKIINHTDAHKNTTTFVQDFSGNITASIDGKRNETKYSYNLKNELETVVDPKQQQTSYEYDGNGNLK